MMLRAFSNTTYNTFFSLLANSHLEGSGRETNTDVRQQVSQLVKKANRIPPRLFQIRLSLELRNSISAPQSKAFPILVPVYDQMYENLITCQGILTEVGYSINDFE
jgi:hypothetical protein